MCKYLEAFVVLIIVIPLSLGYQQNLFLIQGSMWDLGKDCVTLFRAVVRDTPFCVPDTLWVSSLCFNGVAIKYGSTEQDWLCDDALLDSEKDVICGVYHVYTGKWSPIQLIMNPGRYSSICYQMMYIERVRQRTYPGGLRHLLSLQVGCILDTGLMAVGIGSNNNYVQLPMDQLYCIVLLNGSIEWRYTSPFAN